MILELGIPGGTLVRSGTKTHLVGRPPAPMLRPRHVVIDHDVLLWEFKIGNRSQILDAEVIRAFDFCQAASELFAFDSIRTGQDVEVVLSSPENRSYNTRVAVCEEDEERKKLCKEWELPCPWCRGSGFRPYTRPRWGDMGPIGGLRIPCKCGGSK